ncbi:uncharacterized protein TNIN_80161 [Trichonephila inaurata madagascariensis]|uniref:Uncharacterized protein n=1 Tax=Trichonephila inaurata madagascariensis TaxID=2747483 RepID=A0A8X6X0T2_9ARAC|nr:uncharacterized protein TNIN_80161 [Trichonephila inaurata madagascariensis]
MSGKEIPSVLDPVVTVSSDSCSKPFYNETIDKCVLKDFAQCVLKHPARIPLSVSYSITLSYLALHFLRWIFFNKYSRRMELGYSIFFWPFVDFLSCFFFLHHLTVVSDQYDRKDTYGWPEQSKQYLLTLYSYTLVLLALFCYNVVFKTFFKIPISRSKWCITFAVLCITSSFSILYGVFIHCWSESDEDSIMNTYRRIEFVALLSPEPREIIIFLLWNHIIPGCLISFLTGRVIIELVKRNEWDLLDKDKPHSMSYEDRKYIMLSLSVGVFYVITNNLFILQTTAQLLTDSEAIDYYIPDCFEFCPFVILPVDYLLTAFYFCFANEIHAPSSNDLNLLFLNEIEI